MVEDLFVVMCGASGNLQGALRKLVENPDVDCAFKYIITSNPTNILSMEAEYHSPNSDWYDTAHSEKCGEFKVRDDVILIPSQEDLQGFLTGKATKASFTKINKFERTVLEKNYLKNTYDVLLGMDNPTYFTVMWLLFVHKELWNQTWPFEENKWVGV